MPAQDCPFDTCLDEIEDANKQHRDRTTAGLRRQHALALREAGVSMPAIARALGLNERTVYKLLAKEPA